MTWLRDSWTLTKPTKPFSSITLTYPRIPVTAHSLPQLGQKMSVLAALHFWGSTHGACLGQLWDPSVIRAPSCTLRHILLQSFKNYHLSAHYKINYYWELLNYEPHCPSLLVLIALITLCSLIFTVSSGTQNHFAWAITMAGFLIWLHLLLISTTTTRKIVIF